VTEVKATEEWNGITRQFEKVLKEQTSVVRNQLETQLLEQHKKMKKQTEDL
jgi:hypothetical protein